MSKVRVTLYLTATTTTVGGQPDVVVSARLQKQICDKGCEPRCCQSQATYLTTPQTPLPETLSEQLALLRQLEWRVGKYIRNGVFIKEQVNLNTQFQTDTSNNIQNASNVNNFVGVRLGAIVQTTSPTLITLLVHAAFSCLEKDEESSSLCNLWHHKECGDDICVSEYTSQVALNPGVETEVASWISCL
jgi:hypothetical protein